MTFLRASTNDVIFVRVGISNASFFVLLQVLRSELQRAEVELQDKCWVPPPALQHWLQLTYELELKSYNRKKHSAERQLRQAKDAVRLINAGAE